MRWYVYDECASRMRSSLIEVFCFMHCVYFSALNTTTSGYVHWLLFIFVRSVMCTARARAQLSDVAALSLGKHSALVGIDWLRRRRRQRGQPSLSISIIIMCIGIAELMELRATPLRWCNKKHALCKERKNKTKRHSLIMVMRCAELPDDCQARLPLTIVYVCVCCAADIDVSISQNNLSLRP